MATVLGFRKNYIDTLKQQMSSFDAKLELTAPDAVNGEGEAPTTNTYHELQSGKFVCRQPECPDAKANTVFTRSEFEKHQSQQHSTKQYNHQQDGGETSEKDASRSAE